MSRNDLRNMHRTHFYGRRCYSIRRRNAIYLLNIIFPLIGGLIIYLTKVENTYISDFFAAFHIVKNHINYPPLIRFYACDFLWAYSLFFGIRLSLGDELRGMNSINALLVATIVAIVLELLQIIKRVPGTFDVFDIVVELIAIVIAYICLIFIERRENYEEKQKN